MGLLSRIMRPPEEGRDFLTSSIFCEGWLASREWDEAQPSTRVMIVADKVRVLFIRLLLASLCISMVYFVGYPVYHFAVSTSFNQIQYLINTGKIAALGAVPCAGIALLAYIIRYCINVGQRISCETHSNNKMNQKNTTIL